MRKKFIMLLSFAMFAILLSLSISGASRAYASSTSASAYVSTDQPADLLARARINSLTDIANDTDTGIKTFASAYVSASQIYGNPVQSYATAWIGNVEVAWDSWSK